MPLFIAVVLSGTFGLVGMVTRRQIPTLGAASLADAGTVMLPPLLARWTTQPCYA